MSVNPSFEVVEKFEEVVAKFAGSRYAVATNTGTSALFLSMKYFAGSTMSVLMPARTFISVPLAALHCGLKVEFENVAWHGVYRIEPMPVWDGALRFRKDMFMGGLHCLSFHARKLLNIGEGGMVLTDDTKAAAWLRAMRYSGRKPPTFAVEDIEEAGYQAYLTPEKAARGLHLMEYMPPDLPDQKITYPDLRQVKLFQTIAASQQSEFSLGVKDFTLRERN